MKLLILISILVCLLNIPFGYWRANVERFSLNWFLAIHLPVPLVVILRLTSGIGFAWYTYVFLVSAFFLGQQVGALVWKELQFHCPTKSSCLVMDLYRCASS